jgi:Tfp pilus assembly protein PilZ
MASGRKDERVTINKEFESFDQFMSEYVTNLSRTGAFIRTSTPLPIGTEVDLRFTVVLEGVETIEGIGEVVRIETSPPGMGIVFKELNERSQELIERLLSRNEKGAS